MKLIANPIGNQICTFLSLDSRGSLLLLGCLLLSFSIHLDLTGKRRWMTGQTGKGGWEIAVESAYNLTKAGNHGGRGNKST